MISCTRGTSAIEIEMKNPEIPDDTIEQQRMLQASSNDVAGMVTSLCEAFADDPGLSWIWPDRDDRLQRLPHFFKPIVQGTQAYGTALHSPRSDAVSLWRQPGRINPSGVEISHGLSSMAKAFSAGRERSMLMSQTLKARQPKDLSWWYLQFIGVRPALQRSGLGGAAVRAGIALARAARLPVYVEVMNPNNIGYYHHVGFDIVDEFDIPDAGPHVWAMIHQG
jgi:ribosomal protein S18 acetylase RimI-like enzyme